jgi:type II secretory pathway pseudopilin PulG
MATRDEQGVALALALVFIVLVGVVTTALLSSLTSSVDQRSVLDNLRGRQYAADGAVEREIARVRGIAAPGAGLGDCNPAGTPRTYNDLDGVTIRVDCTNVPTLTRTGYIQRDVVFTSCISNGSACTTANTIVRAQVNYEAADAETPTITKTYIQSWTVTR